MRIAALIFTFSVIFSVTPAIAQDQIPIFETSVGAHFIAPDDDLQHIWFVDGAFNCSRWFTVVALVDWATMPPVHSQEFRYTRGVTTGGTVIAQTYNVETVEKQRAVFGGVRFVGRELGWVAPFAQALGGFVSRDAPATVTPVDDFQSPLRAQLDSGSGSGLGLQVGGGLNLIFSNHLGAVAQMSYRRNPVIKTGARQEAERSGVDNVFDGLGDYSNEIRVSLGLTLRLGKR